MKKTIRKREYDTQTAELLHRHAVGFFGDPAGYEETLYRTPDGYYFLYVCGGPEAPYTEEDIRILAKTKVKDWMASH